MSHENAKTLEVYENSFDKYIDGTVPTTSEADFQGLWLKESLTGLGESAKILEIGSAHGRDADFIKKLGYSDMQVSDATDSAVLYLKNRGYDALKLDILEDQLAEQFDAIIACAVFLHFTEEELRDCLSNLKNNLEHGKLIFSVKNGIGEEWSAHKMEQPRYFHYWQKDELTNLLFDEGYKVDDFRITDDGKWLHFVVSLQDKM